MSDALISELRHHEAEYQELVHGPLCGRAADEIGRLRSVIRVNWLRQGATDEEINRILDAQ